MKKLFVVFMSLMFIMCLAGCNQEVGNEKMKNVGLLQNEYNEETVITLDYLLEDKIDKIKEGTKNEYLINYIYKEKYCCGYINEELNKEIKDIMWIKGDNILYSFKTLLNNNKIDFEFDDIKWIEYNNVEDILYKHENYSLQFIFKFNDVQFIEDIFKNTINRTVPHIISVDFSVYENQVNILKFKQLEEGKYLLYGNNLKNYNDISFNLFIAQKDISTKYEQYILKKISNENLIIDCIQFNENENVIDIFKYKYGIYENDFENIIMKKNENGGSIFGYWNYEDYNSLIIKIIEEKKV